MTPYRHAFARRRATIAFLAALALLLTACDVCGQASDTGRYPVTIEVVEEVSGGPLGPASCAARVTAPDRIVVERQWCENVQVIAHELRHIVQWNEIGADFLVQYALQVIRYGYEDAPFEVEAREAAFDVFYVRWARDVIAGMVAP